MHSVRMSQYYLQLFRERLSQKWTRQSRKVLWVFLSSLFVKEIWKNGMRGHGRMFASAEGKQRKQVWKLQCQGTLYWSYPILPFGIVACTLFPTTFLEIAVKISSLLPNHSKPMVFKIDDVIKINDAWAGGNVGYRNTFFAKTSRSYNGPAVRI